MKFATFFALFIFFHFSLYSQEITIVSGNYKNLKNISEYNLVFDYSDLTVTEFESEEAYLQKTMLEKEQLKPGTIGTLQNFSQNSCEEVLSIISWPSRFPYQ